MATDVSWHWVEDTVIPLLEIFPSMYAEMKFHDTPCFHSFAYKVVYSFPSAFSDRLLTFEE